LAGSVETADRFEHPVVIEGLAPVAQEQLELEGLAPFLSGLLDLAENLALESRCAARLVGLQPGVRSGFLP
jgi:hypothetical protein